MYNTAVRLRLCLRPLTSWFHLQRPISTSHKNQLPPAVTHPPNIQKLNQRKRIELNVNQSKPYRDRWRREILCKTSNSSYIFQEKSQSQTKALTGSINLTQSSNKELIAVVTELTSQTLKGKKRENEKRENEKWDKVYDELADRVNGLTKEEVFYALDCAYVSSHYPHRFLWLVSQCWSIKGIEAMQLTRDDIVHLLFYIAMTKDIRPEFFAMCEAFIEKHLQDFSVIELSMICTTYFSCNISFRSYATITGLANYIISQPPEALDLVMATNFLKVFRHAKFSNVSFYAKFADLLSLKSFGELQSLSSLSNIAVAYAKIRVRHDRLFGLILSTSEDYARSNKNYRDKDILRILSSCAQLRIPVPETFIQLVLEELQKDVKGYPDNLVENAVLALGMMGYFPSDLISSVLASPRARASNLPSHDDWETFQYIDAIAQTLGENYSGPRLPAQDKLGRDGLNPLLTSIERRDGFLPLYKALQKHVGDDCVGCEFILNASLIPDIVLHLDSEHIPQQCPEKCGVQWPDVSVAKDHGVSIKDEFIKGGIPSSGAFETPSNFLSLSSLRNGKHRRISVKVMSFNQYTVNTPRMMTGRYMLEVELLNRMGYDVLVVWPVDAHRIPMMTEAQMDAYIQTCVLAPLGVNSRLCGQESISAAD